MFPSTIFPTKVAKFKASDSASGFNHDALRCHSLQYEFTQKTDAASTGGDDNNRPSSIDSDACWLSMLSGTGRHNVEQHVTMSQRSDCGLWNFKQWIIHAASRLSHVANHRRLLRLHRLFAAVESVNIIYLQIDALHCTSSFAHEKNLSNNVHDGCERSCGTFVAAQPSGRPETAKFGLWNIQ